MSDQLRSVFDQLHTQYFPMVHQMCMGFMKGDHELANDLSQDIFVNVWNALPSFRQQSSYKTWIYRITVNCCLQHIRKQKNKAQSTLDDTELTASNESSDYKELYHAIGQLNEIDRLVIMMVLDEVDYDEISKIIGINPVNLRVKIHRIKSRLKKILENE